MKIKSLKEETLKGNIELYGNKQVIIEGAKGVVDYSEDFLKIDLGNICIKITGTNLVIESFIYEQVDVKGEIVALEFMN
ncbi:MAG: YabP/YqfC family sporulation protein [Clostridia bacterium]|nr:YabP/YqfC family sporulation protein [Clostridia bacterium]